MSTDKPQEDKPLQGEGNKAADARYREAATRHAQGGNVEKEAREAARELDEHPEELAKAEREGKKHIAEEDPELNR